MGGKPGFCGYTAAQADMVWSYPPGFALSVPESIQTGSAQFGQTLCRLCKLPKTLGAPNAIDAAKRPFQKGAGGIRARPHALAAGFSRRAYIRGKAQIPEYNAVIACQEIKKRNITERMDEAEK